jgi:hypothetical protein
MTPPPMRVSGRGCIGLHNIPRLFEKAFSLCYDPPHGCIHHGKAR